MNFELEKFRKIKENKINRHPALQKVSVKWNAEQLWETTLDPESRILAQVTISDTVEADDITTTLMSSNVPPRREFIIGKKPSTQRSTFKIRRNVKTCHKRIQLYN